MRKELKEKWLEALRSGKYKQGRGKLRSVDNEFCCLGVLCDVSGQGEWDKKTEAHYWYGQGNKWGTYGLPLFMNEFTGLTMGTEETLFALNDVEKLSFNEIADWIEENVEEDQ